MNESAAVSGKVLMGWKVQTKGASVLFLLALGGCASSKVTQSIVVPPNSGPPIKIIAISPGGGVLGEAVGVELFNLGYTIVDPGQTMQIAGRYNLSEIELGQPKSLDVLREEKIDALLVVKGTSGYDGRPQSASARVVSTATGQIVAAVSWQNGWGGQEGSMADRQKRKDVVGAAREIAKGLRPSLR